MAADLPITVHGYCNPRFARVREAFLANFEAGLEVRASFAAEVEGELVADVWAGYEDAAGTRPWRRDTIVNVFSTTKAMVAVCAHVLVDRGLLDFNAPVAKYWPEFAQNGKADIPMRWLMSHQAGVPSFTAKAGSDIFYDWDAYCAGLAAEAPWWEPGTANGYHAFSFGNLVGEVVRRISGRSLGTFCREEVTGPLNADFHIGFGPSFDQRVADMITGPPAAGGGPPPGSMMARIVANPPFNSGLANSRAWRAAEIPAANGHGNARSCARVMSALACGGEVDGIRIMSGQTVENAITERCSRKDLALGRPMRWGLGFMLASPDLPFADDRSGAVARAGHSR